MSFQALGSTLLTSPIESGSRLYAAMGIGVMEYCRSRSRGGRDGAALMGRFSQMGEIS